ncbi:MAG TPA: acylphosphatase [Solimonas sp.]|nr:acylphosphatase [Solimonas sp.]
MRECYRFIVSGRVQGVFFRQSTLEQASRLGLDGWVRNLPDGRVEGVAAGEAQALQTLRRWLERGPPASRVEQVEWQASAGQPGAGFSVIR